MGKVVALIKVPSSKAIVLSKGIYLFECWGAQGGIGLTDGVKKTTGGKGSYTSGIISISKRTPFYLFVGGKGEDGNPSPNTIAKGGLNGGGNGGYDTSDNEGAGGGGGSSDIRLINGAWDEKKSLVSRIMVAAGGSGSTYAGLGAPGGKINGFIVTADNSESYASSSTSQINGYSLGRGENGRSHTNTPSSGAGGGYYGGIAVNGIDTPTYKAVSSSGSSFISGYVGCNAVDSNGYNINSNIHPSKLIFFSPVMKAGNEEFFSPSQYKEKGHSGNGAVSITRIAGSATCRNKNNRIKIFKCHISLLIYS